MRAVYNAVSTDTLVRIYLDLRAQATEFPQDPITPSNITILLRHVRHLGDDVQRHFERLVGHYLIKASYGHWDVPAAAMTICLNDSPAEKKEG
jgi:hypothetical protein